MTLRRILPPRYWKSWNRILVSYGQTVCTPRNPKCRQCPVTEYCEHAAAQA
jgi:endonuclease-3